MSEILEMAHEMARDLHEVGAMGDITMRQMDVLCLPLRRALSPEEKDDDESRVSRDKG
jgi:putative transcriptional regulator